MNEAKRAPGFDRRSLLQLAAVAGIGGAATLLLRSGAPLGTDVGDRQIVRDILADSSSPAIDVPGADLTLVAYTDYRCPACRLAHPAMKRAVEQDGKVRLVFKDWPIFGPASERAAKVALAAVHQGVYPDVHDRFMRAADLSEGGLRREVEAAGADWARLIADLERFRTDIATQLGRNATQAFALGLGGTPAYLVGPILVLGAMESKDFAKVMTQARESQAG